MREFDVEPNDIRGKSGLAQIILVEIDREHAGGIAPLHLDCVEAAIASNIEHGSAAEVGWQRVCEASPFNRRIIAEKVLGGSRDAGEIDIVKPRAERRRAAPDLLRSDI